MFTKIFVNNQRATSNVHSQSTEEETQTLAKLAMEAYRI